MSTQPTPTPKRLYVICHGALATRQDAQSITIMIPNLGATHSYRAGTWLAETTIQEGSLTTLEDVTGGMATLPYLGAVDTRIDPTVRPPFATFVLPRPINVYPLFQVIVSKDAFVTTNGAVLPTADLVVPYIPVFEYNYTETPTFGDLWPVATDQLTGLPDDPLTLHIYAEDEIPTDDGHSVEAFNLSCRLLGLNFLLASDLQQDPAKGGPLPAVPPGMENRLFEFQPLDHRREALLTVSEAIQSGAHIPNPWSSLPTDLGDLAVLFFGNGPTQPPQTGPGDIVQWNKASCLSLLVGVSGTT
jgi:hypothetical protein